MSVIFLCSFESFNDNILKFHLSYLSFEWQDDLLFDVLLLLCSISSCLQQQ